MDTWDCQFELQDDINLQDEKLRHLDKITNSTTSNKKLYHTKYFELIGLSHRLHDGTFNESNLNVGGPKRLASVVLTNLFLCL